MIAFSLKNFTLEQALWNDHKRSVERNTCMVKLHCSATTLCWS